MTRSTALGALALAFIASSARAEEPRGCDKFKWNVDRERTALTTLSLPVVQSGQSQTATTRAFTLALSEGAALPRAPERTAKTGSYSGFVSFAAPTLPGTYQVALSSGAWIDLVQGAGYLRPAAFSGALDCSGVRKVVRFDLAAEPFLLQVSGAANGSIDLVVEPVMPRSN